MPCDNCDHAKGNRWWPRFTASCERCRARDLAQGIDFWHSRNVGELTPAYKALLKAGWGEEWRAGHLMVKECA